MYVWHWVINVPNTVFNSLKLVEEDGKWMETALSLSIHNGLLDLLRYLIDTKGVTLTGEFSYIFD